MIQIAPPAKVTSSGKPSYYNGLLVKYSVLGNGEVQTIKGTACLIQKTFQKHFVDKHKGMQLTTIHRYKLQSN